MGSRGGIEGRDLGKGSPRGGLPEGQSSQRYVWLAGGHDWLPLSWEADSCFTGVGVNKVKW